MSNNNTEVNKNTIYMLILSPFFYDSLGNTGRMLFCCPANIVIALKALQTLLACRIFFLFQYWR